MSQQMMDPEMQRVYPAQDGRETETNDQQIETLAQQIIPRVMPEIMYQVRSSMQPPPATRERRYRMAFTLAIVSIVMMVPLTAIILGEVGGLGNIWMALVILAVVMVMLSAINIVLDMALLAEKNHPFDMPK